MILHHYHVSPLSEKVRLMFGYCGMQWQSMITPPMPPRPVIDSLVGGYRRIPIAQIGADFFCDSCIIASEIASLSGRPTLATENNTVDVQRFVESVDAEVFMAVVHTLSPAMTLAMLLRHHWPWQVAALLKDRAQVAKTSALPRQSRKRMMMIVEAFKKDIELRLAQSIYLFGNQLSSADFTAYYVVWFANKTRRGDFLSGCSHAQTWFANMAKMGHGQHQTLSKESVFDIARDSQPRHIPQAMMQGEHIGEVVKISPSDYARDATQGVLVGQDKQRWIIARETEKQGVLHVHFPKKSYALQRIN